MKYILILILSSVIGKCTFPENVGTEVQGGEMLNMQFYDLYRNKEYEKAADVLDMLLDSAYYISPSVILYGNKIYKNLAEKSGNKIISDSLIIKGEKLMSLGEDYYGYDLKYIADGELALFCVSKSAKPISGIKDWFRRFNTEIKQNTCIGSGLNMSERTIVEFVIEKDGRLTNLKISENGKLLCQDGISDMKTIRDKWIPARFNENVVRQKFMFPIL